MKTNAMGTMVMLCLMISLTRFGRADNTTSTVPTHHITMLDADILKGLSPYNWIRTNDYVATSGGGASYSVAFSGTRNVVLEIDPSNITTKVASRYPILAWTVNGGHVQSHQLAAGESSLTLCSDTPNPSIEIYVKGMSPFEDRYASDVPKNAVKITGFEIDSGGKIVDPKVPAKIWLNIGDSIMSGDAAGYAAGQGRPPDDGWAASDDAKASYGYLLAQHYGYWESRLAWGGYDWGGGAGGLPRLSELINKISSTTSRLEQNQLNPPPAVVLINLGENGAPTQSSVTNALSEIRNAVGGDAKLIVIIPLSGKARDEVTKAFNNYKSSGSGDEKAYLVDLESIAYATADGQHPTAGGHQSIYSALLPKIDAILQN